MESPREVLEKIEFAIKTRNAAVANLSYEEICYLLKFYCGFNPKTAEGIKSRIADGLPSLKDVSVQITDGGLNPTVRFTMPDGQRKTFRYC
ncbi:MAG: hypothetical protein V4690_04260 [Patescibacteria group bacterium]